MANREEEEEAAPLLKPEPHNADSVFSADPKPRGRPPNLAPAVAPAPAVTVDCGEKVSAKWAAEGVPLTLANGSVIGEPLQRDQWDSGLFSCLGRNDEFCSSDLEVWSLVGFSVPCMAARFSVLTPLGFPRLSLWLAVFEVGGLGFLCCLLGACFWALRFSLSLLEPSLFPCFSGCYSVAAWCLLGCCTVGCLAAVQWAFGLLPSPLLLVFMGGLWLFTSFFLSYMMCLFGGVVG
ncbi:hypothetical protein M5K25_018993 [Dendrobium thyrsiflorum]|uniref:Uncharacterized protein n=1 Tax=Dendrobium thyrsiflorum TaxID=117978 RepID=A0ABD0UKN9_DENTH